MILEERARSTGTRRDEAAGDCTVVLHDETMMWTQKGARQMKHGCGMLYLYNLVQRERERERERESCAGGTVDIRTGTEKIGERAVLMRIQKRQMARELMISDRKWELGCNNF